MSNEKYNGWTNYPTWNVKLWIDNDYGMYHFVRENIKQIIKDEKDSEDVDSTRYQTQQFLESYINELVDTYDIDASFVSDCLGWAIGQVNWREIAVAYLEEVKEELETA